MNFMAVEEDSSRQREWADACLVYPDGAKKSRVIEGATVKRNKLDLNLRRARHSDGIKPFKPLEDDGFYSR